jgi:hypothetical protein
MTLQQGDKSSEILAFRLKRAEREDLVRRAKPNESQSDLLRRVIREFIQKTRSTN